MAIDTDRRFATFEELRAIRPAKTPAQVAALRAAEYAMDAEYAGSYVAYTDTWGGDTVARVIVAVTPDPAEFQRLLAALAPDVRSRVRMTLIPPADVVSASSVSVS